MNRLATQIVVLWIDLEVTYLKMSQYHETSPEENHATKLVKPLRIGDLGKYTLIVAGV